MQPIFISIHAPRAGCDAGVLAVCTERDNFNPRTPCGVRRAPTAAPSPARRYFNPRTPCGVRPHSRQNQAKRSKFQSTHPVRGATTYLFWQKKKIIYISIHAPRAGCDKHACPVAGIGGYFNPRTPCGVRLVAASCLAEQSTISIHAPRAGCDDRGTNRAKALYQFQSTHPVRGATFHKGFFAFKVLISIHAPRAGCDFWRYHRQAIHKYFNPRTPCGVRLGRQGAAGGDRAFQSTHPVRGATWAGVSYAVRRDISIHAPRAGCD